MTKTDLIRKQKSVIPGQKSGFASIEAVVLITVFLLLISYTLGFFGAIHGSILHSIAARNYAFETFRHRTNLVYFRPKKGTEHYQNKGLRFHAVVSENQGGNEQFQAPTRPIAIGRSPAETNRKNSDTHNNQVPNLRTGQRNESVEVSPMWIKVRYGLCIDLKCGDS